MKAIAKLLFVALLIGVALSLPTKVKAGGTTYTFNWTNYSECYGCVADCEEEYNMQYNACISSWCTAS